MGALTAQSSGHCTCSDGWASETADEKPDRAELEARWNIALQKTRELEQKLQEFDVDTKNVPLPSKELLLSLAQDLPAVWNAPTTDMRLKQRIMHILIEEIMADVDASNREILLLIHWAGGRHSELRLKKRETGQHRRCTSMEAVEVVRQMAGRFTDESIAAYVYPLVRDARQRLCAALTR